MHPPAILQDGRLAQLPASATEINAAGWSGFFTGEDFLAFRASPQDIEAFLTGSPSLKGATPEVFSPAHMRLPRPAHGSHESLERAHEYYDPEALQPSWFDTAVRVKGRRYLIPPDPNRKGHNWGAVIVNDETNTVYVSVNWS